MLPETKALMVPGIEGKIVHRTMGVSGTRIKDRSTEDVHRPLRLVISLNWISEHLAKVVDIRDDDVLQQEKPVGVS
jgi:hypothetical protein